ncbi:DUF4198 domain-containing protein, partial [Paraglaciecola sp.]|uniref:DUF4198 domain-containing protein n=1 Tax=Paraglaciecola sp. TaxID=1920173 RepID=UPI0030F374B6
MKLKLSTLILTTILASTPLLSHAHRAWIMPAATVLSADKPWVTFDAAVSNDIFHSDHAPFRLEGISVMSPDGDGTQIALQNSSVGKYRSTFDLELAAQGTYKVYAASNSVRARWVDAEGKRQSWPGRRENADIKDFAKNVPQDAKDLNVSQSSRRIETFVTAGTPSTQVFTPTNEGLELVPITHPNDLYAGETAQFSLLIDGKPAIGAEVIVLAGGMRYRNAQDEITA